MRDDVGLVDGRACGSCTMCCTLLGVAELDKAALEPCRHCRAQTGCAAYADRPTECRQFYCEYLIDPTLGEAWKPSQAGLLVTRDTRLQRIEVHVEPGAAPWRQAPYGAQILAWASQMALTGGRVIVSEGDHRIVLAPDGSETDLFAPTTLAAAD